LNHPTIKTLEIKPIINIIITLVKIYLSKILPQKEEIKKDLIFIINKYKIKITNILNKAIDKLNNFIINNQQATHGKTNILKKKWIKPKKL